MKNNILINPFTGAKNPVETFEVHRLDDTGIIQLKGIPAYPADGIPAMEIKEFYDYAAVYTESASAPSAGQFQVDYYYDALIPATANCFGTSRVLIGGTGLRDKVFFIKYWSLGNIVLTEDESMYKYPFGTLENNLAGIRP